MGVGLEALQRPLLSSTILWFCDKWYRATPAGSKLPKYQSAERRHLFPSIPPCLWTLSSLTGIFTVVSCEWWQIMLQSKIASKEILHNQIWHWRKRSSDFFLCVCVWFQWNRVWNVEFHWTKHHFMINFPVFQIKNYYYLFMSFLDLFALRNTWLLALYKAFVNWHTTSIKWSLLHEALKILTIKY